MAERKQIASLTFTWLRSTKNTHRYQEQAEEGEEVVGALYVQKDAIDVRGQGVVSTPSTLYVTIEA